MAQALRSLPREYVAPDASARPDPGGSVRRERENRRGARIRNFGPRPGRATHPAGPRAPTSALSADGAHVAANVKQARFRCRTPRRGRGGETHRRRCCSSSAHRLMRHSLPDPSVRRAGAAGIRDRSRRPAWSGCRLRRSPRRVGEGGPRPRRRGWPRSNPSRRRWRHRANRYGLCGTAIRRMGA